LKERWSFCSQGSWWRLCEVWWDSGQVLYQIYLLLLFIICLIYLYYILIVV